MGGEPDVGDLLAGDENLPRVRRRRRKVAGGTPPRPSKRTRAEVARREEWAARPMWPCVILATDPGAAAGATLVAPGDGWKPWPIWTRAVETASRELEDCVKQSAIIARAMGLPLVLAMEDWGAGGMRGIEQWLGLGAAAGAWSRAFELLRREGYEDVISKGRVARVRMVTWRSMMIPETGDRSSGQFVRFDGDGWKQAAAREVARRAMAGEVGPHIKLESPDAAESVLIGLYAARADEVGCRLNRSWLREHGREQPANPRGRKKSDE